MGVGLSTRLPDTLAEKLRGYSFSKHPYDETGAEIHVLSHPDQPRLYLKIRLGDSGKLEKEYLMLKWINQRVPTPEPIYYTLENSTEYLLTSEITGTPTYQVEPTERETAVTILATALKKIHNLDPADCPVIHSVDKWIKFLEERGIDVSSLGDWRPVEKPVFTHGDYCLPNIIVGDGALSGVIDWDFAGLADPYVDLVSCIWSIGYNYGEETDTLLSSFLETYGVELEQAKYDFYKRLNELIP